MTIEYPGLDYKFERLYFTSWQIYTKNTIWSLGDMHYLRKQTFFSVPS